MTTQRPFMTTSTTRRLGGALLALALGLVLPASASAAPITFEFMGQVTESAFATIPVGSAVSGSYTFDDGLTDQAPGDLSFGFYGPVALTITFADSAFADGSSVSASDARIVILNNGDMTGMADHYAVRFGLPEQPTLTGSFAGRGLIGGSLHRLEDTAAEGPFTSDSLPLTPPDLASLPIDTSGVGFMPEGTLVRFTLTSLTLAAPETQTLTAAKDSFLRKGAPDRNEGANPGLRLQAAGDNRVVVAFDPEAIDGFGNVTTATLVLTIAEIADNWGKNMDRTVDAHPLAVDFAEGNGQAMGVPSAQSTRGSGPGVTWNCAEDAEIANQQTDCDPRWDGGDFGPATADPVLHVKGLSGAVSWDVTTDVQAGATAWLIKKTDERQAGKVVYHSKDGADAAGDPDLAPRLILE